MLSEKRDRRENNTKNIYFVSLGYVAAAAAKSLQSCPTVRPHRRQPTRLPRPWDSPGKNTGVGCHFLLQCYSSKASILWHSAFFMVQLSHPYMTTGKTIALTRQTFVGKVMSLLFNMLFRLVITFLPRSIHLLI